VRVQASDDPFYRFAAAIRERLAPATQFTPRNVAVVRANLGNQAGVIGAATLMGTVIGR
jgi:predicted NBD/HSP70 family sugar kinase